MPRHGAARLAGRLCLAVSLALSLALSLAGCRQNMHNQPKVEPFEESDFFPDGVASRVPPEGTVARGFLRAESELYTGTSRTGQVATAFPLAVTPQLLRRGQERFNIYCSPCHDRAGTGRGMIVQRGYKQPSSYHIDRLRAAPVGYFYGVITQGFGVMPSYASQVPPEDRWAIVAYIRALQLAQDARLADLTPEERRRLEEAWRRPPANRPLSPEEGQRP